MKKILLAEDDPLLLDIYTTKLREEGFQVLVADRGDKALELLEAEKADAILLDIVLPYRNGWDVLEAMKKNDAWKGTKILVLSNLGQREEIEKSLDLGADRYLLKAHYTPSEVVEEIKKVMAE